MSHKVRDVVTDGVRTLVTLRHDDNLRGTGEARRRLTARGEVSVGEGGPEITLLVIVILVLKKSNVISLSQGCQGVTLANNRRTN